MTKESPEVLTFGCRLNSAESETMQRHALDAGLNDVVIVNTCAVTAEAERQAGQAIRRIKRENPAVRIVVTGCSSQINPQKYAAMAEVESVIPNDAKLSPAFFFALSGKVGEGGTPPSGEGRIASKNDIFSASPQGKMQRAFVQVQNGCDNHCTFCVIPYGRGASRSLSFEAVAKQVHAHVAQGFNEIVLTGVDIASYGRDLPGEPTLGFMIRHVLAHVPTLQRLRLSSLDPANLDEDLWELIGGEPRLMPHLHLSLQAGDDTILKRMKRRHLRADVFRLVERARKCRPDIAFGADIIAGFPTETEEMFANTLDLVKQCELTWLHVFPYSSRQGTPAARMPHVHGSLRKERAEKLRAQGNEAVRRHYEALIGKTVKVLVEKNGIGCTPQFAKCKLQGHAPVGQIVGAKCLKIEADSVVAEVIKNDE